MSTWFCGFARFPVVNNRRTIDLDDSVMNSNEKQMLRAKMKARLRSFSGKASASQKIRGVLSNFPLWKSARIVFGFMPLPGEPDWFGDHPPVDKLVAYPRVGEDGMTFFFSSEFRVGPLGVNEPLGGRIASHPDLVLVPGLAFDATGARLGRGKGFYDRWLAANAAVPALGVCFKCQILETLPLESHDTRVNAIVTEDGVLVP
jgi:5-formyltetrahydrofolate cyclo-ligase